MVALTISIIALVISILIFFKDIEMFRKKLKITITDITVYNEKIIDEPYKIVVTCIIDNNNQYPITITNAYINDIEACRSSLGLLDDYGKVFFQDTSCGVKTLKLPYTLNGFRSTSYTAFVLTSCNKIKISNKDNLIINTTRGNVKINLKKYLHTE